MRHPEFYAAVFGIIRDEQGKILVIKRKDTGHLDGWYGLPAGHIEGTETPTYAMSREILEEVGLTIPEENIKLINVTHRINDDRVVIDFYYEILSYTGTPYNAEPERSDGIYWIDWKDEQQFQSRKTLQRIELGETYSELDFRP